jgi:rod shape-determining protein MreC
MRSAWNVPLKRDVGVFLLLIVLSVSVMAIDRTAEGGALVGALAKVFMPFEILTTTLMNFSFIHKENHILRSNMVALSQENALLREQVHEAARLRRLLGFSAEYPDTLRSARVAVTVGERMGGGIVINRGDEIGLARNMTVISPDGLVGVIVRAGRGASHVRRIVDPGYKVSAMTRPARATGILGAKTGGDLVMEWVAPDAEVAPGDTVISSGLGSITPKGIPIGVVRRVRDEPERFSLALEVEPFVDFRRLEEVFIIVREPPDFGSMLTGAGD